MDDVIERSLNDYALRESIKLRERAADLLQCALSSQERTEAVLEKLDLLPEKYWQDETI